MAADSLEGTVVSFESEGEEIVGRLFAAGFGDGPAPGVVIIGPENFQKELQPLLYARRLAALGYTALIFDPRYRGESAGEPRCYENPLAKIADTRAALRYMSGVSDVDPERLGLIGICFGASYTLKVAADEPLVRVLATITGHYRDHAADLAWLGSEEAIAARRARGQSALEKYRQTGEVEYVPCVDHSRGDVGMPGEMVWSWYQLWADRGLWENRYAVMSDAAVLAYESLSSAARLTKPFLMIHADLCAIPDAARRHFAVVPTADKRLQWEGQTRHLQFYDDPAVIDRAVVNVVDWFSQHLGSGGTSDPTANGQGHASALGDIPSVAAA